MGEKEKKKIFHPVRDKIPDGMKFHLRGSTTHIKSMRGQASILSVGLEDNLISTF